MNALTHEFLPEEVMAFLDGELSPERAAVLSAHLESCKECSALLADFRSLSGQIKSWQITKSPASVAEKATAPKLEEKTAGSSVVGARPDRRPSSPLRLLAIAGSCLAGFVLLVVISVPNLLRSRMAANESSAVGSLRTLNTAAVAYRGTYGHYPLALRNFGPSTSGRPSEEAADLVDAALAGGHKSGFLFTYQSFVETYAIRAEPESPGQSGYRRFSTDQTGVIRALDPNGKVLDEFSSSAPSGGAWVGKDLAAGGNPAVAIGPMIARTAEVRIAVERLDDARTQMDRVLAQHKGYIAQLSVSSETSSARNLTASLRVPVDQLDACIGELKKLGRVIEESLAGEEVTKQYTDLAARLKNSRTTETRLNEVVQQRTGKVADILEVEKESARVRGEIEQMEAEQKTLEHRVEFATIDLKLSEEYKAQLSTPAPSVGMQLRNATVNGFRNAFDNLLGIVLFFAESGPTLVLWLTILGIPAWLLWRRYRRVHAVGSLSGA